jgi:molybdopterin converting factor small subunit
MFMQKHKIIVAVFATVAMVLGTACTKKEVVKKDDAKINQLRQELALLRDEIRKNNEELAEYVTKSRPPERVTETIVVTDQDEVEKLRKENKEQAQKSEDEIKDLKETSEEKIQRLSAENESLKAQLAELTAPLSAQSADICSRTSYIRHLLESEIGKACSEITIVDLSEVETLTLGDIDSDIPRSLTLNEGDLDYLFWITDLNIENVNIEILPDGIFRDLISLESVGFEDVSLVSIQADIFKNSPVLSDVYFQDVALETLPENFCATNTTITTIWVRGDSFKRVPKDLMKNHPHLTSLKFQSRSLETLPEEILTNAANNQKICDFRVSAHSIPIERQQEFARTYQYKGESWYCDGPVFYDKDHQVVEISSAEQ